MTTLRGLFAIQIDDHFRLGFSYDLDRYLTYRLKALHSYMKTTNFLLLPIDNMEGEILDNAFAKEIKSLGVPSQNSFYLKCNLEAMKSIFKSFIEHNNIKHELICREDMATIKDPNPIY